MESDCTSPCVCLLAIVRVIVIVHHVVSVVYGRCCALLCFVVLLHGLPFPTRPPSNPPTGCMSRPMNPVLCIGGCFNPDKHWFLSKSLPAKPITILTNGNIYWPSLIVSIDRILFMIIFSNEPPRTTSARGCLFAEIIPHTDTKTTDHRYLPVRVAHKKSRRLVSARLSSITIRH